MIILYAIPWSWANSTSFPQQRLLGRVTLWTSHDKSHADCPHTRVHVSIRVSVSAPAVLCRNVCVCVSVCVCVCVCVCVGGWV